MLQQLLTATISYIGTTTDYFIILLLVFSRFKKTVQIKSIVAGAYFGNLFLVIVSLIIALFLKRIPQEYLLGLLGLIPIILGIKNYFFQNDEAGDVKNKIQNSDNNSLIIKMIGITIATCGADNIALYVPYFTTVNLSLLPMIFIIFIFILSFSIFLAQRVTKIKIIYQILERFGDKAQLFIYVILGIYVMFSAGTIQHFLN